MRVGHLVVDPRAATLVFTIVLLSQWSRVAGAGPCEQLVTPQVLDILAPKQFRSTTQTDQDLSYIAYLKSLTLQEAQREADMGATIIIPTSIGPVPLSAHASRSQQEKYLQALETRTDVTLSTRDYRQIVMSSGSDKLYDLIKACLVSGSGISLDIGGATPTSRVVTIAWNPSADVERRSMDFKVSCPGAVPAKQTVRIIRGGKKDVRLKLPNAHRNYEVIVDEVGGAYSTWAPIFGSPKPKPYVQSACAISQGYGLHDVILTANTPGQIVSLTLPPGACDPKGRPQDWDATGSIAVARTDFYTTPDNWFVQISGFGGLTYAAGSKEAKNGPATINLPANFPVSDDGRGHIKLVLDVGATLNGNRISLMGVNLNLTPRARPMLKSAQRRTSVSSRAAKPTSKR